MKSKLAVLVTVWMLVLTGSAAASGAFATFVFENALTSLEIPIYEDPNGIWRVDNFEYETSEFSLRVHDLALDPDPSIAYGIAVVDLGAPSVFGFLFGTPIVPTGAPNVVTSSIVGGLTDFTGDGVAMTPIGGPFIQTSEVGFPMTNMGVDVGPGLAAGPASPGAFYNYGAYSSGPITGPGPGPWTFLTTSVTFGLSGGGDIAALTGFTRLASMPRLR